MTARGNTRGYGRIGAAAMRPGWVSLRVQGLLPGLALAACAPRSAVWITPGATITVDDGRPVAVNTDPSHIRLPIDERSEVTIQAPGRSIVRISVAIQGAMTYGLESQINTVCVDDNPILGPDCAESGSRHPIEALAEDDGPFELPASGEGLILAADAPSGSAVVLASDDVTEVLRTPLQDARSAAGRSLPLVVPLAPGAYEVMISATGRELASTRVTVRPGEYALLAAVLVPAKEHYGSFLR